MAPKYSEETLVSGVVPTTSGQDRLVRRRGCLVAVKSQHSAQLLAELARVASAELSVVCLQNGVFPAEAKGAIAALWPRCRLEGPMPTV